MCRKKLLWVCVTFNLLYERKRERGGMEGTRGGEEGEGERQIKF